MLQFGHQKNKKATKEWFKSLKKMKNKILSLDKLEQFIKKAKSKNKKIVLCHGVFDLLHIGHIKHFIEAKNLGIF